MRAIIPALGNAVRGLLAIVLALPIAAAVGLAIIHVRGDKLLSVQTASMSPTFRPGDSLVVAPVSPAQLNVGDIVSYQSPRDPNVVISHRLVAMDRQTGSLTTQGDALNGPDPTFPPRLIIGRATAVAPKLGLVLSLLRRPAGLALAVYLPAAAIVVAEVRRLARAYTRQSYSARL